METRNVDQKLEGGASEGTKPHASVDATTITVISPRAVRVALNRVIIAGRDEVVAANAAASVVDGAERRARLRDQAKRRVVFQHDLTAAVTAVGGVPARNPSGLARLMTRARRIRALLIGAHAGDAYAVCARTAGKSVAAYSKALLLDLPADVRFGLERQCAEVESDHCELRRLRWGASPSTWPVEHQDTAPEAGAGVGSRRTALEDARALEDWTEDGGAGADRRTSPKEPPRLSGAMH